MAIVSAELDLAIDNALTSVQTLDDALLAASTSFSDELTTALAALEGFQLPAPDTTALTSAVDDALATIAANPVDVPVVADTGPAVDAVDTFVADAEAQTVDMSVNVDPGQTQEATTAFDNFGTAASNAGQKVAGLESVTGLLETATSGAKGELGGAATALGGVVGVSGPAIAGLAGVGAGFGLLFDEGLKAQSATERLSLIFGQFATQVLKVDVGGLSGGLEQLAQKAGSSSTGIEQATAKLGQLAEASGLTQQQAAGVVGQFQALALRATAMNPSLGDAGDVMDKLTSALSRGGRSASAYGISLSTAEISTRALADTGKAKAADLTTFERAVAGAELSVEKLGGKLNTDFQAGADQSATKFKALQAAISNTLGTLGTPIVAPILSLATDLTPVAEAFAKVISAIVGGLIPAFAVLQPVLSLVGAGVKAVADALNALGPVIPIVVSGFVALRAATLVSDGLGSLSTRLLETATNMAEVGGALPGTVGLFGGLGTAAGAASSGIGTFAAGIGGAIVPVGLLAGAVGGLLFAIGAFDPTAKAAALQQFDDAMARSGADAQALSDKLFGSVTSADSLTAAITNLSSGLDKFITTSSRFKSSNQLDDLQRIGINAQTAGLLAESGAQGLAQFFDAAVKGGEISGNLADALTKVQQQSINLGTAAPTLTAALDGNAAAITKAEQSTGPLGAAYQDAKKQLADLGGQAALTGPEFAALSEKQQRQVIATLQASGANADLITSFKELQGALSASEKTTFDQFTATSGLSDALTKNILANSLNTDGTVNYTLALKNAADATKGLGDAFAGLGPNAAAQVQSLSDLSAQIDKTAKSGLDLGKAFGNALKPAVTEFGINDLGKIKASITDLQGQGQATITFFDNVDKILASGSPALADALLKLGPTDLGARASAQLAANNPLVQAGWENALEGMAKAQIVEDQILADMKARTALGLATVGNAGVAAFADKISGGKGLAKLTDDEMLQVALKFQNAGGPVGAAAQSVVDAAQTRFLSAAEAYGLSATQAAAAWTQHLKDAPGAAAAGQGLVDNAVVPLAGFANFGAFGLGAGAGQGFADGLSSKEALIRTTAQAAVAGVTDAFARALKSQSPSKVMFAFGESVGDGFALGMLSKVPLIDSASGALTAVTLANLAPRQFAGVAPAPVQVAPAAAPASAPGGSPLIGQVNITANDPVAAADALSRELSWHRLLNGPSL